MTPWLLAPREEGASARSCDFLWSQALQVDPETHVRAWPVPDTKASDKGNQALP